MSYEADIVSLITLKNIELETKGFTSEQASAAVKRARKWAQSLALKVSPQSRDRVFFELFQASLNECEAWLIGIRNSRKQWQDGLEAAGAVVGPQSTSAYETWSS